MAASPLHGDTIAAVATPPGRGGIGVVRASGPAVAVIAKAVIGDLPTPRNAVYRTFQDVDGNAIDHGIALYFPSPASFTGEDVLELQGHGGPVVMQMLLQRVMSLGARPARPGEFSQRAFLNDRIDLAQAEAIADLIDSSTTQAARCALRTLDGVLSRRTHAIAERLVELRTFVEAALDFPDEEIDFLADSDLGERIADLLSDLQTLQSTAQAGRLLRDGIHLVILGPPNAGKSSLLNCLAGRDTAIVTDVPGTTRDLIREAIDLDGIPIHLVDTAGLRDSPDPVEREGVRRAHTEAERADQILLVVDATASPPGSEQAIYEQLPGLAGSPLPMTLVRNKIDLSTEKARLENTSDGCQIYLSARTGEGIALLRQHIKQTAGMAPATEGACMARSRHIEALNRANASIEQAMHQLVAHNAGELVAEELRLAHTALSEITGEFSTEDLLERIFSSFCIGK
jgi:tRNA modification GTPase